jgi:hypothetical protein
LKKFSKKSKNKSCLFRELVKEWVGDMSWNDVDCSHAKNKTTEEDMIIINTTICFNKLSVKELMEKIKEMVDLKI